MSPRYTVLALIAAIAASPAHAVLAITNVQAERSQVARGQPVSVRFRLEEPANVTLSIYDGRDLLIRHVSSQGELAAGDNALTWDGRDEMMRGVPAEAYVYTLTANRGTQSATWDVTEATGGSDILPRNITHDSTAGKIRYLLDVPARVSIRIGFQDNGPLLRTVVDWVARPAGPNEDVWDGWDASQVLPLQVHPKLDISVAAFQLPDNTILIGEPAPKVALVDVSGWPRSVRVAQSVQSPRRMYAHSQQPLETRSDFDVQLVLPDGLSRTKEGVPVITGAVPIKLTVSDGDRARALARRFEPVFFLDGQFVFENEVGFIPMTWNWDPRTVNPGEHFLTVNLRGYEGNFGMATVKVFLQRGTSP